jgi:hypothetical protein
MSVYMEQNVRFIFFPKTELPPFFAPEITTIFQRHEWQIGTILLDKGLTSNEVLSVIRDDLIELGFEVEKGKRKEEKIGRPVFFGENGQPTLKYEIDAYHSEWHCALEVEAGRAWMGNAIYRDLIQALVMVEVDILALAVPIAYKYRTKGRATISQDFDNATNVIETLFSHSRFQFPYRLLLIGY